MATDGFEASFEDSLAKAKETMEKLMRQDITLEQSIKLYEEGLNAIQNASKQLEEAKVKISNISQSEIMQNETMENA
jgi:exodeoxyribonuclease VII small subunit